MSTRIAGRRLLAGLTVIVLAAGCAGGASLPPTTPSPDAVPSAAPTAAPTAPATDAATASLTASAAPTAAPTATYLAVQMTHGRSVHTATALNGGRILLAGGYFDSVPITSVDLYDAGAMAFSATGPMATARGFDTATLLDSGRVLIVGGNPGNWDFAGPLIDSAETYDPTTGVFTATGSMTTPRDVHTATLLLDGRVLITGGDDTFLHPLASAEIYDPMTGVFTATGSMTTPRDFHVATLLADGRVLVTGGSPFGMNSALGQFLTSAEIYNPSTGRFSPTGSMGTPRSSHTATLLGDGRVLITGGATSLADGTGTVSLSSAELYDPTTGEFSPTASMDFARTFQQATLLADGRVLVSGGDADGWSYAGHYLASAEIYDPGAGTFATTGPMTGERTYHTATALPDGRVLIAGGHDVVTDVATAELFDPETGTFRRFGPGG